MTSLELAAEALAEDDKAGGGFDRDEFTTYLRGVWGADVETIEEAWRLYCQSKQ
jgi:hypothetical protein